MIHERLIIRNLGPIREACLDIAPVTVLVGETGSGKSLVAKTLAMMRHVCKMQLIRQALRRAGLRKSTFRLRKDSYAKFADITTLIKPETKLRYSLKWGEDEVCQIDFPSMEASFGPSDALGPFIKVAFVADSRNLVAAWERKGASIQSKVLDNYFAETFGLWEAALDAETVLDFPSLGLSLSKGKDNGGRRRLELINAADKGKTLFSRGASGQKAAIPVSLITRFLATRYRFDEAIFRWCMDVLIKDYAERQVPFTEAAPRLSNAMDFSGRLLALHIEEPELGLDPKTQIGLLETLMADFCHAEENGTAVRTLFTTHSPYWVVALNTLVAEGKFPGFGWGALTGYHLTEGTAVCIRDEEQRLLMAPNLDAATETLDDRFNAALAQELGDE